MDRTHKNADRESMVPKLTEIEAINLIRIFNIEKIQDAAKLYYGNYINYNEFMAISRII